MQILNSNEISTLELKERAGKMSSKARPIYDLINTLELGQGLKVEKSSWPHKSHPSNGIFPKDIRTNERKYATRSLVDNSAWVIVRTN